MTEREEKQSTILLTVIGSMMLGYQLALMSYKIPLQRLNWLFIVLGVFFVIKGFNYLIHKL